MKKLIVLLLVAFQQTVVANPDSTDYKLLWSHPKVSVRLDANFMNVTGRTGFRGVGMNGTFQMDYAINERAYIGIYGGHATDISTRERFFQIDTKIYDLTTSNMSFFGLVAGYSIYREGRLSITPDLKMGLGYFRVSEIFNTLNNNFIMKRSLLMITPRLNFSFLVGKSVEPGVNFSYLIPASFNGDISQYDLGNVSAGVFCKFYFQRVSK